jgi:hypothetical protein
MASGHYAASAICFKRDGIGQSQKSIDPDLEKQIILKFLRMRAALGMFWFVFLNYFMSNIIDKYYSTVG